MGAELADMKDMRLAAKSCTAYSCCAPALACGTCLRSYSGREVIDGLEET